jgi:hypothetical protein
LSLQTTLLAPHLLVMLGMAYPLPAMTVAASMTPDIANGQVKFQLPQASDLSATRLLDRARRLAGEFSVLLLTTLTVYGAGVLHGHWHWNGRTARGSADLLQSMPRNPRAPQTDAKAQLVHFMRLSNKFRQCFFDGIACFLTSIVGFGRAWRRICCIARTLVPHCHMLKNTAASLRAESLHF